MEYMYSANIRWRKSMEGWWVSMLTATAASIAPRNAGLTRKLQGFLNGMHTHRDEKLLQVFRIGIVLVELVLLFPISDVSLQAATSTVTFCLGTGEEVGVYELASMVEEKSNVLVGDVVFFCLNAVLEGDEDGVEERYFMEVVRRAEVLDGLGKGEGRRGGSPSPVGSGVSTPRSEYVV
jgi:hypothetical protein